MAGEHSGMVGPFSGGCACGAVRYVCASPPIALINCHYRDCQRSSGAPFASGVVVLGSDMEVICMDDAIPHFAESPQGPQPVRAT